MQYKFTGKEQDPETGLYYFGARYYDAQLSKWVSADPAFEKYLPKSNDFDTEHDYYWYLQQDASRKLPGIGGIFNSVNLNVYHYAGNNPVKLVDPDGNWGEDSHLHRSFQWNRNAGLSEADARRVSVANNATDSGETSPITGDQSYHFNTNNDPATFPNNSSTGTVNDSRIIRSEQHLEEAIKLWKLADTYENDPEYKSLVGELRAASLEHLGMGEHALMDIDAHADSFVSYAAGRWKHVGLPFTDAAKRGEGADDPGVQPQRILNSEERVDIYIKRFIEATGYDKNKR